MQFQKLILGYKLFTYFVIKNEYTYGKLKYEQSHVLYFYDFKYYNVKVKLRS